MHCLGSRIRCCACASTLRVHLTCPAPAPKVLVLPSQTTDSLRIIRNASSKASRTDLKRLRVQNFLSNLQPYPKVVECHPHSWTNARVAQSSTTSTSALPAPISVYNSGIFAENFHRSQRCHTHTSIVTA